MLKRAVFIDTKDAIDSPLSIRKGRRICGMAMVKKGFLLVATLLNVREGKVGLTYSLSSFSVLPAEPLAKAKPFPARRRVLRRF